MFGKNRQQSPTVQIQQCQCGGINLCFGNVTVHMKKEEFLANATKIEKAKNFILTTQPGPTQEVHHEIH